MALTVREVEAAQPGEKIRRLYDEGGLYLEIRPTGSRLWMLQYRFQGREKRISLGPYPAVSLRKAREQRDDASRLLRDGVDPSAQRRVEREVASGAHTFRAVAEDWWETWRVGKAESTVSKTRLSLGNDILPALGARPIAELQPSDLVPVLRAVERRGAVDTAHRVGHRIGMIFRRGVALGRCERDIAADLSEVLVPRRGGNFAAVTDAEGFGALLRALDGYQGDGATALALRLAPLVAVRPGELRRMEWGEVDLEAATWEIPAAKMKRRRPHIVPLSRQAVAILREAEALRRGPSSLPRCGALSGPSRTTPCRRLSGASATRRRRRLCTASAPPSAPSGGRSSAFASTS